MKNTKKLKKNQGLKLKGFTSGFHSGKTGDTEATVTIHVGKIYNSRNIFSFTVPYEIGLNFVGKDLDIIIVPIESKS